MKIVINTCYGGFNLSYKAVMAYAKLSGRKLYASEPAIPSNIFGKFKPYVKRKNKREPLFLSIPLLL